MAAHNTPLTHALFDCPRYQTSSCSIHTISSCPVRTNAMASGQQPARGDQSTDNPHRASHAALQQAGPLLTPPCASALPVASLQYGAAGLSFSAGGTGNGASGNEWGSQGRGAAANGIFFDNSRAQVIPGNVDPRVGGSLMGHASMSVGAGVPRGTDGGEITAAASDGPSFDARFPPTLSGIETSTDTESMLRRPSPPMNNLLFQTIRGRPPLGASSGPSSTGLAAPPPRAITPPPTRAAPVGVRAGSPVEGTGSNETAALRPSGATRSLSLSPKRRSPRPVAGVVVETVVGNQSLLSRLWGLLCSPVLRHWTTRWSRCRPRLTTCPL